jgi:serine protease
MTKSGWVLSWFLGATVVAVPAVAAPSGEHAGRAFGLIVKLRDATPHEAAREGPQPAGPGQPGRPLVDQARWQRVLKDAGLTTARTKPVGRASHLLEFNRPLDAAQAREMAQALMQRPDVESVVPNERERRLQAVPPNDPFYAPTLQNPGQWWLRRVGGSDSNDLADRLRGVPGFEAAWSTGVAGSQGDAATIVAVLDTGIISGDAAHPELAGKVLTGYDFVSEVEFANDFDGRDGNPADPGDWVSQAESDDRFGPLYGCEVGPSSWHGTIIAGQIAALTNNAQGVAGMAWNSRVLAVRVAGKCGASVSDIVDGIRWAAGLRVNGVPDNPTPARIINISFGGSSACNAAYQDAIDEVWASKGAVVIAAGGNEHASLSRPASCNKAVGVVALNRDGFKSNYSNFGGNATIATVGGDDDQSDSGRWSAILADSGILTLDNCGTTTPRLPSSCPRGPYAYLYGTSFSAPIVSGAAALMLSVHPDLTAQQIVDGLKASARPHVTSPKIGDCAWTNPGRCICTKATCGVGILDAEQAVRFADALKNGQVYTAPNWPVQVLDSTEVAQAVALGPDRDPNAPVPAPSSGGGGGAASIVWLALLVLAIVALGRGRREGGSPTGR